MARLGKRERARRRSNTCKQPLPEENCRMHKQGSSSTAAAEIETLSNDPEIAAGKKMKIPAPLLRRANPAALAASKDHGNAEIMDEGREDGMDMQIGKKKKRIEEVALKKMEMAQAALRSVPTEAIGEEKLTRLRIVARGLAERIEEMADAARERGLQAPGDRGLRKETCRLKRKVGRLQESKRALKRQVQEAQEALLKQHKELEERTLCMICHDLPRDTFVLPCLHFLYCFSCLSKHSSSNNSCPSCRRSILGLCMASSLASSSTSQLFHS